MCLDGWGVVWYRGREGKRHPELCQQGGKENIQESKTVDSPMYSIWIPTGFLGQSHGEMYTGCCTTKGLWMDQHMLVEKPVGIQIHLGAHLLALLYVLFPSLLAQSWVSCSSAGPMSHCTSIWSHSDLLCYITSVPTKEVFLQYGLSCTPTPPQQRILGLYVLCHTCYIAELMLYAKNHYILCGGVHTQGVPI